jgi:hypothetical protein
MDIPAAQHDHHVPAAPVRAVNGPVDGNPTPAPSRPTAATCLTTAYSRTALCELSFSSLLEWFEIGGITVWRGRLLLKSEVVSTAYARGR